MLAVFRTERSIARIRMAAIGPISAALKGPHGRQAPPRNCQDASACPPTLLSVRDVANSLRVHRSRVYSLCSRGELAHVRVSNAVRIRADAVEEFLKSRPGVSIA